MRLHQRDFVELALEQFAGGQPCMLNMDGTGSGKTLQQLALAHDYRAAHPNARVLIVTKNTKIIRNAHIPDARKYGMEVVPAAEPADTTAPGVYITTPSRLSAFERESFDLVIVDESHIFKNDTQQTKAGTQVLRNAKHRALFSATPLDKPTHMEYLCESLDLNFQAVIGYLGYAPAPQGGYRSTLPAHEVAARVEGIFDALTRDGLAVKRERQMDNLDLVYRAVTLDPAVQERYDRVLQQARDEWEATPTKKGRLLLSLRRLAEEGKIDAAMQSLAEGLEAGQSVVLFASRVNNSAIPGDTNEYSIGTLTEISRRLTEQGIAHSKVFGGADDAKNEEEIRKFQDGRTRVILTTPESGGTGISLDDHSGTAPRKAICMTTPFSAMEFVQLPGRIDRMNTKSRATFEVLVSDTHTDRWSAGIIFNKMSALGAAVKGQVERLAPENPDAAVGVQAPRPFNLSEFQRGAKRSPAVAAGLQRPGPDGWPAHLATVGKATDETPHKIMVHYPLTAQVDYAPYIPVSTSGQPDPMAGPWLDARLGFGKYSGQLLSAVHRQDPGYVAKLARDLYPKQLVGFSAAQAKGIEFFTLKSMHKAELLLRKLTRRVWGSV